MKCNVNGRYTDKYMTVAERKEMNTQILQYLIRKNLILGMMPNYSNNFKSLKKGNENESEE